MNDQKNEQKKMLTSFMWNPYYGNENLKIKKKKN